MPLSFYSFYYEEPTLLVLLMIAIVFTMWAQVKVKSTFAKYDKIKNTRNMTGAEAAEQVLRINNVSGVRIERISGNLNDHFDPRSNVIRLSDSVYSNTSVSALGVAAHEAGHAVQYDRGYLPMKLRSAIIPVTNIGSNLAMPLIILGFILSADFSIFVTIGILLFSMSTVFQLVTLPVEFDASIRAMKALDSGNILGHEELKGARNTLTAAAMTYVAALAVSIINLLRIIARFGGRRND